MFSLCLFNIIRYLIKKYIGVFMNKKEICRKGFLENYFDRGEYVSIFLDGIWWLKGYRYGLWIVMVVYL